MSNPVREQLIEALYNEYVFLCHDDYDPESDTPPEVYLEELREMTDDELIEESSTDEHFTLEEYLNTWA